VPPLTSAALVSLGFVCARLGTLFSIGLIAPMVPTCCGCGAIPGVRSVTRAVVPGARAVIAGTIVRVSGARTMFPGAEVSQAVAEILHFARELIEAPLKFGCVCCWSNARKRSSGDGFGDAVCAEGHSVQLNIGHTC
jgi:hypothetical protein